MSEGKAVPFQISLASARVNAEMTQERELSKLYGIPIDYIFLPKKSN